MRNSNNKSHKGTKSNRQAGGKTNKQKQIKKQQSKAKQNEANYMGVGKSTENTLCSSKYLETYISYKSLKMRRQSSKGSKLKRS